MKPFLIAGGIPLVAATLLFQYHAIMGWILVAHHFYADEDERRKYGTYEILRKGIRGFKIAIFLLALSFLILVTGLIVTKLS